jgi:hypothetical protein
MAATTNFEKLIATYITQLEELEVAYFQLIDERTVETAVGEQLNVIGALVGEDRFGRDDEDYRVAIKGRIRLNLSSGTTEDIIAVIASQLGATQITITEDSYPAHFEVFIPDTLAVLGASVASAGETFPLVTLDELVVRVDGGTAQTIIFDAADFADITQATAAEVASVIDLNLAGGNAVPDVGRVLMRSDTLGDVSSLQVLGGTANDPTKLDFDFGNLTLATNLTGAAETAVVVSAAIPVTAPEAGTLAIELDSGARQLVSYTSFTGSTFTIPATSFAGDNATAPKEVVIAIEHTGEEENQALMVRISNTVQNAKAAGVRGILFWNTCVESFGFLGTTGALGFDEGCFASALDA